MQNRSLFRPRKRRISLTALIDVVFILLLFFMLTTSFQHWKQLDLRVGSTTGSSHSKQHNLVLLLTPALGLVVSGNAQTFADYRALNLPTLQQLGADSVTLLPHQHNAVQAVVDVLQHLNGLGIPARLGQSYGDELTVGLAR